MPWSLHRPGVPVGRVVGRIGQPAFRSSIGAEPAPGLGQIGVGQIGVGAVGEDPNHLPTLAAAKPGVERMFDSGE